MRGLCKQAFLYKLIHLMKICKHYLFFTCIVFFSLVYGHSQNAFKPLLEEEKINDFLFLYEELKATYPYFEINKRVNKVDWLSNKESYIEKIKSSKTDLEYYNTIVSILNDLNNGHTDTYPTIIYDYCYDGYRGLEKTYPAIKPYVVELEKSSKERALYWKQLVESTSKNNNDTKTEIEEDVNLIEVSNVEIQFNELESIAYIKIKSFSYDLIENDKDKLKRFFVKSHEFKNLIIDIQGNEGGSDTYWIEHIVSYLIEKDISFPIVFAFKKSERINNFKPDYKTNIKYSEIKLPNLPEELKTGEYSFLSDNNTVEANGLGRAYKGKLYVLIDGAVFSSSDTFAYFCKVTSFATLIGEKTAGDGIGTDPLLLTLPKSGIVIRFTGEMALNPDGSSNEEHKTIPHYLVKGLQKENDVLTKHNLIKTALKII